MAIRVTRRKTVLAVTGVTTETGLNGKGNDSSCERSKLVDAVAIAITFLHYNIGITEISGKSKTTIFQCISRPFESLISIQNIYLNFYTEKTAGGKVTLKLLA